MTCLGHRGHPGLDQDGWKDESGPRVQLWTLRPSSEATWRPLVAANTNSIFMIEQQQFRLTAATIYSVCRRRQEVKPLMSYVLRKAVLFPYFCFAVLMGNLSGKWSHGGLDWFQSGQKGEGKVLKRFADSSEHWNKGCGIKLEGLILFWILLVLGESLHFEDFCHFQWFSSDESEKIIIRQNSKCLIQQLVVLKVTEDQMVLCSKPSLRICVGLAVVKATVLAKKKRVKQQIHYIMVLKCWRLYVGSDGFFHPKAKRKLA